MSYRSNRLDEHVVELLQSGGVGFMPSDTIYGLSCLALDEQAVLKLHKIKDRSGNKPFIVLISDTEMLNMLSISGDEKDLLERYWPGSLSVIFKAPNSPEWLQLGSRSLAVRLPADKNLCELISKSGPLISTSANPEGGKPANSVKEAGAYFGEQLDFYVDAGDLSASQPSTLARIVNGKLEVIRQGAVKINEEDKL